MRIAISLLFTVLILGCGGLATKPVALTNLPPELSCLSDAPDREPGRIENVHEAAAIANKLYKASEADIIAKACDPSTNRLELGYVVYALAIGRASDDVAAAAKLLEWDAIELGNPQAAAKVGSLFVTGGPDGKPPSDPVKASGYLSAANEIGLRIADKAGRGKAVDAMAPSLMRVTGLRKHGALIAEQEADVQKYRKAVTDAFERQVEKLD